MVQKSYNIHIIADKVIFYLLKIYVKSFLFHEVTKVVFKIAKQQPNYFLYIFKFLSTNLLIV